jgi:hypothetical protein
MVLKNLLACPCCPCCAVGRTKLLHACLLDACHALLSLRRLLTTMRGLLVTLLLAAAGAWVAHVADGAPRLQCLATGSVSMHVSAKWALPDRRSPAVLCRAGRHGRRGRWRLSLLQPAAGTTNSAKRQRPGSCAGSRGVVVHSTAFSVCRPPPAPAAHTAAACMQGAHGVIAALRCGRARSPAAATTAAACRLPGFPACRCWAHTTATTRRRPRSCWPSLGA